MMLSRIKDRCCGKTRGLILTEREKRSFWCIVCIISNFSIIWCLGLRSFGVIRIRISDPRSVWIMAHQKNRWVQSGHGFTGSFDAPWSRQILDRWSGSGSPQRNAAMTRVDSPVPLMHHDPDRSWITDPALDHPKGTQPRLNTSTAEFNYNS